MNDWRRISTVVKGKKMIHKDIDMVQLSVVHIIIIIIIEKH